MAVGPSGGLRLGVCDAVPVVNPGALTWEDLVAALDADLEGPAEDPVLPTGPRTVAYYENLLAVGQALVTKYAPAAPASVQREATFRCCGYLHEHTHSAMSQLGDSGKQVSFSTSMVSALRHSRAMALLTFWKRRRAL